MIVDEELPGVDGSKSVIFHSSLFASPQSFIYADSPQSPCKPGQKSPAAVTTVVRFSKPASNTPTPTDDIFRKEPVIVGRPHSGSLSSLSCLLGQDSQSRSVSDPQSCASPSHASKNIRHHQRALSADYADAVVPTAQLEVTVVLPEVLGTEGSPVKILLRIPQWGTIDNLQQLAIKRWEEEDFGCLPPPMRKRFCPTSFQMRTMEEGSPTYDMPPLGGNTTVQHVDESIMALCCACPSSLCSKSQHTNIVTSTGVPILEVMQQLIGPQGVEVRERRREGGLMSSFGLGQQKDLPPCFVGREMIEVMIDNKVVSGEEEANMVAQKLILAGWIKHVESFSSSKESLKKQTVFKGDGSFWEFDIDRATVMSVNARSRMKRPDSDGCLVSMAGRNCLENRQHRATSDPRIIR